MTVGASLPGGCYDDLPVGGAALPGYANLSGMTAQDGDGDIPFTREATTTAKSAGAMARAWLGFTLRQMRLWVVALAVLLVFSTLILLAYTGSSVSIASRVYGSLFWGGLLTLVTLFVFSLLVFTSHRRNFRLGLPPGGVQRTGFGDRAFVTASALSSSRISYSAVQSVHSHRGFVFIQFVGQPVTRAYPLSLFPPEAMAQLRGAVPGSTCADC